MDISPIALYRWYKWVVLFREIYVTYLDVLMVLGRDLGPTIEIGPVMTMKVLKKNCQVVYRSLVRSLVPYYMGDETIHGEQSELHPRGWVQV